MRHKFILGYLLVVCGLILAFVMSGPVAAAEKSAERIIRENSKAYTGATRILDGNIVRYPKHYSLQSTQRRSNTFLHMNKNAVNYYSGYARHKYHTEVKYIKDDLDNVLDTTIKILVIKKLLD